MRRTTTPRVIALSWDGISVVVLLLSGPRGPESGEPVFVFVLYSVVVVSRGRLSRGSWATWGSSAWSEGRASPCLIRCSRSSAASTTRRPRCGPVSSGSSPSGTGSRPCCGGTSRPPGGRRYMPWTRRRLVWVCARRLSLSRRPRVWGSTASGGGSPEVPVFPRVFRLPPLPPSPTTPRCSGSPGCMTTVLEASGTSTGVDRRRGVLPTFWDVVSEMLEIVFFVRFPWGCSSATGR